jgi:phospholipase D1/2
MAVEDFFLPEDDVDELVRWTPTARTGVAVTPLIDGKEAFAEFEKAIKGAHKSVYFTAWVFATDWDRRAGQFPKWHELFVSAAKRGCDVKLLLADFDPYLGPHHPQAWRAREYLMAHKGKPKPPGSLEVMCSMHPATLELVAQLPPVHNTVVASLTTLITAINSHNRATIRREWAWFPRLWEKVSMNPATGKLLWPADPYDVLYPVTHHQKTLVVDGTIGFCGGLDITMWRNDSATDRHHWHDIHLKLRGDVVIDLERNFVERWNAERQPFNDFVDAAATHKPPGVTFDTSKASAITWTPPVASTPGTVRAQVHRTVSENSITIWPHTLVDQVWRGTVAAIEQAEHYVYVENQYVRSEELVDALLDRADDVPGLVVIAVVPMTPEELATADPITKLGMNLQYHNLDRLTTTLGSRFGVFSPLQRIRRKRAFAQWQDKDFLENQVYVHSKAMIVDDVYANVGSANAGPRSYLMDTEIGVAFHDPTVVRAFRVRLWRELTGANTGAWPLADVLTRWRGIATANQTRRPAAMQGYVVPHPYDKFQGQPAPLIPDRYTELHRADEAPPEGLVV